MTATPSLLAFDRVAMDYPGVRALDGISFGVRTGSVHALVGENGAGKSTLLKILSGACLPSEGSLLIDGERRVFRCTAEALGAGIAVIYQELHLVSQLSVAENLYLGHLPERGGIVDRPALVAAATRQIALVGEAISPNTPLGDLPLAQRQMVAIAKALTRGARIIAFDEPTSSLSDREVHRLFAIILGLKARGCAVLFVSHRLDEIFALCDRITILRDGRHVMTTDLAELTRDAVVHYMVGRSFRETPPPARGRRKQGPGLTVEGIEGLGLRAPCSFTAEAGEIFGFFGLVGAGRSELLRLIFGAQQKTAGRIKLGGKSILIRSPRDAIQAGVVLCPEDRKKNGIIAMSSVLENINLSARRRKAYGGIFLNAAWEATNARARCEQLRIKTPSMRQLLRNLSGGNQQKVILSRWLSDEIRVILLDEPTHGIDVGAKDEIYGIMRDLARRGVCVIAVSSEIPELLAIADRIAVMRQGQIVRVIPREKANETLLLQLALPVDALLAS